MKMPIRNILCIRFSLLLFPFHDDEAFQMRVKFSPSILECNEVDFFQIRLKEGHLRVGGGGNLRRPT